MTNVPPAFPPHLFMLLTAWMCTSVLRPLDVDSRSSMCGLSMPISKPSIPTAIIFRTTVRVLRHRVGPHLDAEAYVELMRSQEVAQPLRQRGSPQEMRVGDVYAEGLVVVEGVHFQDLLHHILWRAEALMTFAHGRFAAEGASAITPPGCRQDVVLSAMRHPCSHRHIS